MTILKQTTLNIFCQIIENLYNWMDNLWLKVENIVAKGEIAHFERFIFLSLCFTKSRLLQRRQKASIWGKGFKLLTFDTPSNDANWVLTFGLTRHLVIWNNPWLQTNSHLPIYELNRIFYNILCFTVSFTDICFSSFQIHVLCMYVYQWLYMCIEYL